MPGHNTYTGMSLEQQDEEEPEVVRWGTPPRLLLNSWN
jgi:hypothetical protein